MITEDELKKISTQIFVRRKLQDPFGRTQIFPL